MSSWLWGSAGFAYALLALPPFVFAYEVFESIYGLQPIDSIWISRMKRSLCFAIENGTTDRFACKGRREQKGPYPYPLQFTKAYKTIYKTVYKTVYKIVYKTVYGQSLQNSLRPS